MIRDLCVARATGAGSLSGFSTSNRPVVDHNGPMNLGSVPAPISGFSGLYGTIFVLLEDP